MTLSLGFLLAVQGRWSLFLLIAFLSKEQIPQACRATQGMAVKLSPVGWDESSLGAVTGNLPGSFLQASEL